MVYNFGEYCEGYVLDKKSHYSPGFRGPGITYYYVYIDVFGKFKECDETMYNLLSKDSKINFYVFNDDPNYLIISEKGARSWVSFINNGLRWYHKIFLTIFIITTLFFLISKYIGVLKRIYNTELSEKEIYSKWDSVLTTIIHSIIFIFGVGCSYYVGWLIFNNISNNENLSIALVGFYLMVMLTITLVTPFILQKIYEAYQKNNSELIRRVKKITIIFTLANVMVGFFGTLINQNPNDFTVRGMFKLIFRYWDVILGG